MTELTPLPTIEPGRYRHYKGGEYLYRPLYNQTGFWVRPFAMFLEPIAFNGMVQPRFSKVDAGDPAPSFPVYTP